MKILFHGRLLEAIGPAIELDVAPGCTVADLRERLASIHPEARQSLQSDRVLACVGDRLVDGRYALGVDETIELLPPVSGG
jgi:molybdopterin converting factor small subunit